MEIPEFEEKQYEWAALSELGRGKEVFPSGQVLESLVGYDAALNIQDSPIWTILGLQAPIGVRLTPALWSAFSDKPKASKLPSKLVSLILQFKRPQYLDHWRAGQYGYWRSGYYRFFLDTGQQERLSTLETAVNGHAIVRYASPAFLRYTDLIAHAETGKICINSAFVSPAVITSHRLWSYRGPGTIGYANPKGEETAAETMEILTDRLSQIASVASLAEHVMGLAETVTRLRPSGDFGSVVNSWPANSRDVVSAWLTVSEVMARTGSAWLVFGFE